MAYKYVTQSKETISVFIMDLLYFSFQVDFFTALLKSTDNVLPSFKAGLHIGEATVGEIGVIKKDIVYFGDVLNTTSRIEGQCNNYQVNILLSSELLERMQVNGEYQPIALGEIFLTGKNEKVLLYTIGKNE